MVIDIHTHMPTHLSDSNESERTPNRIKKYVPFLGSNILKF